MNAKGHSLRQAAKLSGVPTMTFHAWKEKGLVTPDITDNKGDISLFSEIMIERAKEIDAKRKAKKSADSSGNLFDDIPVEGVANGEDLPDNEATPADVSQDTAASGQLEKDRDFDSVKRSTSSVSIKETAAENDSVVEEVPRFESLAGLQDEIAASMNDDQNEKNSSEASIIGEVNPFVESQPVIEVPVPVETAETPTTIDIAPTAETVTLEDRANRIRQLQADVQRGIIEIGFELIAAKKEIGHGGWADWLKNNFDWTQQTANRFMRVSERFGKLNNVVQFQPSTLQMMLALPEGDEEKFIAVQASAGKPIESQSAREVQSAVKEWNQQRNSEETTPEIGGKYLSFLGKPLPHEIDDTAVNAPCVEGKSISEDTPPASLTVKPDNESVAKKYAELIIDPEFSTILPPLKDYEFKLLEENILRDGILDPLVVWNCILLDGHARYEIAKRHNLPFKICEVKNVNDRHDAIIWIAMNQLCRKSLSEVERVKLVIEYEKILQELNGGTGDDDGSETL